MGSGSIKKLGIAVVMVSDVSLSTTMFITTALKPHALEYGSRVHQVIPLHLIQSMGQTEIME